MIITKFDGGLGNQLFQYAFSLYIQKQKPQKLLFDKSNYFNIFYNKYNRFCKKYGIKYEVEKLFNINVIPAFMGKVLSRVTREKSKMYSIASKCIRIITDKNIDIDGSSNIYIKGFFIKNEYALKIKKRIVVNDLKLTNENTVYLKNILGHSSVSIHVRGKQYVTEKQIKNTYAQVFSDYYNSAVRCIREKVASPVFYIFTNDICYAKELLGFEKNQSFIFIESDGPDYEHFYLMSRCKHNIIINSTFSWWAAFLNKNPKKIIITPARWSGEQITNPHYNTLSLNDWIKIPNDGISKIK